VPVKMTMRAGASRPQSADPGARPVGIAPRARVVTDRAKGGAGEDGCEKQNQEDEHSLAATEWLGSWHNCLNIDAFRPKVATIAFGCWG
jgi:hypothetical protein